MPMTTPLLLLALTLPGIVAAEEGRPGLAQYGQAQVLAAQGRNLEALPLARQALAQREAALGPDHEDVAWSLVQVARLLNETDGHVQAEPLLLRAMARFQALGNVRGEGDAADALSDTFFYREPKVALTWAQKAMELRRACGDRPGQAQTLKNLGNLLFRQGRMLQARDTFGQALAVLEAQGLKAGQAEVLTNLGMATDALGERSAALVYLERALKLHREEGNPRMEAVTLNRFAAILAENGDRAASIEHLERCLALFRQTGFKAGEASARNNLATNYQALGDPAAARVHFEAARELSLALDNPGDAAIAFINLAAVHEALNEDDLAMASLEKGLALLRKAGNKRTEGAALVKVARLHLRARRLDAARACLDQALALLRPVQDKAGEAGALRTLGHVLSMQGRHAEALPILEQALALNRSVFNRNQETKALESLARVLPALGRLREGTDRFRELVALQDGMREASFPILTEAQKLAYAKTFEATRFEFIAHAMQEPEAVQGAFDAWLSHKGAVLDAQEQVQRAILQSRDAGVRELALAVTGARRQLAALAKGRPRGLARADYEKQLKDLQARRDGLEQDLARKSRLFAAGEASRRMNTATLSKLLPAGAAYLDFARIVPFAFNGPAAPRYAAFVLRAGAQHPSLVDLGPADPTDAEVAALLEGLKAGRAVEEDLQALHSRLLAPLEGALAGATTFVVSPSGALNLVPFELLGPRGGRILMDRGPLSYVTAGRDLARFATLHRPKGALVLLDDPDFDLGLQAGEHAPLPGAFAPLPGTRLEARAIAKAFPARKVVRMEGKAAGEQAILGLQAPWALHLATHGYFLPTRSRIAVELEDAGTPPAGLENPMLRSGLALAGANAALLRGQDAGLLSAEKVQGLDLAETSMVVLSACNTGVGGIRDTEGVFGLRRAFVLAGAQTLVASLWPVPDGATRALMTAFYQALARGRSKAEALRDAKLALRTRSPHPRAWAGFILVGNPD